MPHFFDFSVTKKWQNGKNGEVLLVVTKYGPIAAPLRLGPV